MNRLLVTAALALCACSTPASHLSINGTGDGTENSADHTGATPSSADPSAQEPGSSMGTPSGQPTTGTSSGPGSAVMLNGPGTFSSLTGFSNPGALGMYTYVPSGTLSGALVVALHGCTQSGTAYQAAGWSAAADVYGFVVLYPEQPSSNNQNRCFNWFNQEDTLRNGESLSIANAIQTVITKHGLDARRVYVTGLSAGGAMTAVMLASYPDRGDSATQFSGFAGGAIMAGLPYGSACTGTSHSTCPTGSGFGDAFTAMNPGKQLSPAQWGDRVRAASPNATRWPRVSIWGGTSDTTVAPANVTELVDQFTNAHGVAATPSTSDTVRGAAHEVYTDASGQALVEAYRVPGMSHGTAIDPSFDFGAAGKACGTAGAYILDKGICSTYYALVFWGEAQAQPPTPPGDGPDAGTPLDAGPPPPSTCSAVTASNWAHVQAGRAYDHFGVAYAKGTNAPLGLDNLFFYTTLHAVGADTWAIGPCP